MWLPHVKKTTRFLTPWQYTNRIIKATGNKNEKRMSSTAAAWIFISYFSDGFTIDWLYANRRKNTLDYGIKQKKRSETME